MRRLVSLLGVVVLIGGVVSAWVARADEEPGEFQPATAKPLSDDSDDSGFVAIDPEVRPASNTSSRRSGGLTGRLKALRGNEPSAPVKTAAPAVNSDDEEVSLEAAAPIRTVSKPRPVAVETEEVDAADGDSPAETTAALPSVLKRPSARRHSATVVPTVEPDEPMEVTSPSEDETAIAPPANATPARAAVSRARAAASPVNTVPAASSTRPSSRPQTLAAGASNSLAVETIGPKAMTIGKPAIYVVALTNQGVQEAADVYLAVNLPDNVEVASVSGSAGEANATGEENGQRLVWKLDRLAPRGEQKLTLELIPQSSAPVDLQIEWTTAPPQLSSRVEILEPKLTMALKGPKDVLFGDTAVYQIIVANPGTGDAEDVVVDLVSDAGDNDAKPIGTLAAGQQKVIEVSMTASQAGPMNMHFEAKSGTLTAEASEEVMVRRANLEVKLGGPALVFAGSEATYKVTVTNSGDAAAEAVQLGAILPEGSEYLGGLAGVKDNNGKLVWSAGTLAPGKSGEFEFSLLMNEAGSHEVELQSKAGDLLASATATTKVDAVADLKLTVNDPQGPIPVGEEVTYEVTITNRGTKAAKQVAVVVNFSEGIEPISVEGATAEVGGGQALFRPIDAIDAAAEIKLKIKARADRAGSHIFRAEVRCSDPETRLASEQTTRFFGSAKTAPAASEAPAGEFVPSTSAKPMATKRW